ncbi:transcription termination factor MTERF5, chloroplastic-like [Chenopodium quinoa]|uniref:transcription termination factor MTERF5, chloroplastic-like n=1 Tax=Chenopodium quinoa TaxID=63459 RepID=UPI000B777CA4|nr:transcription termination factor MTERF5, chloroplastic-like [Chenopodium quinoa]XP_021720608.1 transcription termination factor MTERF5, chloroplastic-like [Chenopodium quinoa]XP_021720616.1 transcription termination factor MTERF5, chloroplastic-like [Chenopodium quinoa]XP_021720624.1 transcription termination factor MTERF5, chloroplastic-like [Chenopodium quinoa]
MFGLNYEIRPLLPGLRAAAPPALARGRAWPSRRLHTAAPLAQELGALRTDSAVSLRGVPLALLAAEKEEAKAVLMLFLKKQGLNKTAASKAINKSDLFIDHLVSQLHSIHKSRYLVGRELTTLEIRDALIPYLDNLQLEHGSNLVDVVENFPNMPVNENVTAEVVSPSVILESKKLPDETSESRKLKAIARVSGSVPIDKLPQHVIYLIELGMDLEDIQQITRKFPAFAYYSLDGKVRPVVEFLLELGIPKTELPIILRKRPQLCGISLSENLIPTMKFLEGLGLDKGKWAKVIYRFPPLLTYSRQKLMSTVDFLYEMGLTAQDVGKILTRCPNIISYSIEENLRPTAEYFSLLGIDAAVVLQRSPQTFGLSIERNLKPITAFFLEKGYSLEDLRTMIQRYGALYTFSLVENMIPKWNFFLTMGYPQSDLVKFPQFFGYSLEERIKPRFALVKQYGVKLILNQVLSLSSDELEKVLKRKLKRNDGKVLME